MKTVCKIFIASFTLVSVTIPSQGQTLATVDFYNEIQHYDLSTIWTADSIVVDDDNYEGEKEKVKRAEPIGYIGENYQRFYIHFTSIIKKEDNPYEYLVSGKTKVKNTICSFLGNIRVIESNLYRDSDLPIYKQGYVICDLSIYEDNKETSTGYIKGKLITEFIIDDKIEFRYDALNFVSDGYSNNQFEGTWTSYQSKKIKKCNWGDYRIPDSGNFDVGAGEFSFDEKYVKNGWENYKLAWNGSNLNTDAERARQIELEEWWK